MSVTTGTQGVWATLNRQLSKAEAAFALTVMAWLNAIQDLALRVEGHELFGITSRAEAVSHLEATRGPAPATIRGRVAREAMVWTVMSVGIALVITLFVIGILDANLPTTGNTDFDNATDNTTTDIATNIEDLGPLLVLLILLAAAIVYVFIIRDQA